MVVRDLCVEIFGKVENVALATVSFDQIYKQYYKRSFLFVKSYVHDGVVAEDITSETLARLWMYMKNNEIDNLKSFLFTSLRNATLDHLKKERMKQQTEAPLQDQVGEEIELRISMLNVSSYSSIFSTEISEIFQRTLEQMPAKRRRIMELSRLELKSNKEIADEMGLKIKGVDYHIYMALKTLKDALRDYLVSIFFIG
ncbi:RNA polymerase sigma-70 factor [Puteibacter caeruleilacunae]|nr:RNA polymerase sigma-70 factor [Puteibacter caeruleilacunae]